MKSKKVYQDYHWARDEAKLEDVLVADLSKDVTLIGVGSRIEIWDKARYEGASAYDDMEEIAEHMAELGLSI